ncbi:MAG: Maf family protein [Acidobacteriota bacterium]
MMQGKKRNAARRIILASSSRRRSKILKELGIRFSIRKSRICEIPRRGETAASFVIRAAREKALKVGLLEPLADTIIVGCDTVILLDRRILGKPADSEDAARMLAMLSGKWHQVLSGLCLYDTETQRIITGMSRSKVKFKEMSDEDISWYVATGEPMDKAGSYGIQELGMLFIEKVSGSYTNIVGLPVELLMELLKKMGINPLSLVM